MSYTDEARSRRRCTALRSDGSQCAAFAMWDDPRQLCSAHAGKTRGRDRPKKWPWEPLPRVRQPARYKPCTCAAYAWPHRPGGGLCRWPEPPEWRCTIPAGTHASRNPVIREARNLDRVMQSLAAARRREEEARRQARNARRRERRRNQKSAAR